MREFCCREQGVPKGLNKGAITFLSLVKKPFRQQQGSVPNRRSQRFQFAE